ncbi:NAD(P)-binding protein [Exidia glandulosa HHB12029]|uniref:NAD(P)-binding protein n=1 Tax=Exidia glandulosa HHB12029 TaxID=1314781 RepID=A0A165GC47_EXIGL|nr:NAD(P)-binding protein [Exidia glandulosa HHB12029]
MPAWLITGSSRGIGFELAKQLAANSANTVFATCRKPDAANSLNELAKSHKNVHVVALDVDDEASAAAAAETVKSALPAGAGIDYLINNAGWGVRVSFEEEEIATIAAVFNTHVLGALRVFRAFLPLLKLGTRKVVVSVSSELGSLAYVDDPRVGSAFPSYSIAKTGLNMLTRKIAKQYPDFIVFAFAPGWIKTEMGGSGAEYEVDDAVKRHIKIYETATLEKHTDKFINQFEDPVAW